MEVVFNWMILGVSYHWFQISIMKFYLVNIHFTYYLEVPVEDLVNDMGRCFWESAFVRTPISGTLEHVFAPKNRGSEQGSTPKHGGSEQTN